MSTTDGRVEEANREADALEEAGDLNGAIDAVSAAILLAPARPRLFALRGRL